MTIHIKCQREDGEVCKCFHCKTRLCKPVKGGREIMGHYVYDGKLYCVDCWNEKKNILNK